MCRIPLPLASYSDADFATVIAATFDAKPWKAILELTIGVGDESGIYYKVSSAPKESIHIEGAYRFREVPKNPYLQIVIRFQPASFPFVIAATDLFAGQNFDPYVFNPDYKRIAKYHGRPEFKCGDQVRADFETRARLACRGNPYNGSQAFVKPYLVMREGKPSFPMLIGTVNSMYWYSLEPKHGIEFFREWGIVREGDITFDCGAHAGQMAAYFSAVSGPRGKVVAFDPFAQNCLQVEAQDRLGAPGRICVVQAGVGARRSKIRVSNNQQMTSCAESRDQGDLTYVDIVPLDDFADEKPTFIKLDVEGAEVDALLGAQELLRTWRPRIFIEVHTQFIGSFGYGLKDFFAALPQDIYDVDFRIEGIDKAWRRHKPGSEIGITAPLLVFAKPKSFAAANNMVNGDAKKEFSTIRA